MPREIEDFIRTELSVLGTKIIEATKEVIDEKAQMVYEEILNSTPIKTGGLRNSLSIKEKKDNPNMYGYNIDYEGYNNREVAYSFIGRTLNKGTSKRMGLHHIDSAVKKLKGMDAEISKRAEDKLNRGK